MTKPNYRRVAGACLVLGPLVLALIYEDPSWATIRLQLLLLAFIVSLMTGCLLIYKS